jgi:hypothetical protein
VDRKTAREVAVSKGLLLVPLTLLLLAATAAADGPIAWQKDIRAALEEGEMRGVPVFVFLARDT